MEARFSEHANPAGGSGFIEVPDQKRASGSGTCASTGICGMRLEAVEPLQQAVREQKGDYGRDVAYGLKLRHNHGSQFMSDPYQEEVRLLGIEPSPAFVREPESNGCAERFVRTLKEQLLWLGTFETAAQLRAALQEFRDQCRSSTFVKVHREWIIAGNGYLTPEQARRSLLPRPEMAA